MIRLLSQRSNLSVPLGSPTWLQRISDPEFEFRCICQNFRAERPILPATCQLSHFLTLKCVDAYRPDAATRVLRHQTYTDNPKSAEVHEHGCFNVLYLQ